MLAVQVIIDTLAPEEGLVHHPVTFSAVQSGSRAVGVLVAVRVVQRVVGHLTVQVVHRGINVRHVHTPRRRFFSHFSKYTVTLLQDGGNMTAHLIRVVILVAGTVVKVAHVRVIRYLVVELDHRVFRLPDIQFREVRLQSAVRIVINVARELYRTHQGARVRSVAIGMALSGNLQNFAGGLIILLFRPYKVGDFIEASTGASGTVKEIQIFHTILITADNKMIYVPNGAMSSGVITNYSKLDTRRIEWNFGVDYGEDYNKVEKVLREIIANDKRILTSPPPFIELGELAASSVNIKIRVWVNSSDYWNVFFSMNQTVYTTFNKEGINFPFPQLTVHQA